MINIRFLVIICLILFIVCFFAEILPAQHTVKTEISAASVEIEKPANESFYQEPEIVFDFVDVEITTIIKFISEITGNNFVYDERIKGKIIVVSE